MASKRLVRRAVLSTLFAVLVSTTSLPAQDSGSGRSHTPRTFGVADYNITTISATNFTVYSTNTFYLTSGSFGRGGAINTVTDWYSGLELPAGAVVDYIGLNSTTDTDAAFGLDLVYRDKSGGTLISTSLQSTVHGWDTDFNPTPIAQTWNAVSGEELVLHVQQASLPTSQFFGWVEIWWKRVVSPAPPFATFNDVPTTHPFFQYVEALAESGVTGGCGSGNYCPDAPVTRGQMAVFLAKALGLHWPGATSPPAAHQ
jgi:hypothetical protein